MGTVPKNFKGKAGRSGRKSAYEEGLKVRAIEKAWGKVMKRLDNMTDKEIKDFALPMVLKSMPQKLEGDVKVTPIPILTVETNDICGNNSDKEDNKAEE